MESPVSPKVSIGDCVYAAYDGHGLILTVEDDEKEPPRHIIYLDPDTWHNLNIYVANIRFLSTYQGTEH